MTYPSRPWVAELGIPARGMPAPEHQVQLRLQEQPGSFRLPVPSLQFSWQQPSSPQVRFAGRRCHQRNCQPRLASVAPLNPRLRPQSRAGQLAWRQPADPARA